MLFELAALTVPVGPLGFQHNALPAPKAGHAGLGNADQLSAWVLYSVAVVCP